MSKYSNKPSKSLSAPVDKPGKGLNQQERLMTIFVTADTHFRHTRIIELTYRPFSSVEEMDNTLISNWNAIVNPRDEIYHLGDFSLTSDLDDVLGLLSNLNGKKYLIEGNHDRNWWKKARSMDLTPYKTQLLQPIHTLRWESKKFVLAHYPLQGWPGAHKDWFHLYAHCHGNMQKYRIPRSLDVGVDVQNFMPVRIEDIYNKLRAERYPYAEQSE